MKLVKLLWCDSVSGSATLVKDEIPSLNNKLALSVAFPIASAHVYKSKVSQRRRYRCREWGWVGVAERD